MATTVLCCSRASHFCLDFTSVWMAFFDANRKRLRCPYTTTRFTLKPFRGATSGTAKTRGGARDCHARFRGICAITKRRYSTPIRDSQLTNLSLVLLFSVKDAEWESSEMARLSGDRWRRNPYHSNSLTLTDSKTERFKNEWRQFTLIA